MYFGNSDILVDFSRVLLVLMPFKFRESSSGDVNAVHHPGIASVPSLAAGKENTRLSSPQHMDIKIRHHVLTLPTAIDTSGQHDLLKIARLMYQHKRGYEFVVLTIAAKTLSHGQEFNSCD